MIKNYLTIAFRNLVKNKYYSFINIFGLAMGMAGCLIILVFIRQELSYDRYHRQAERIFRVAQEYPGRFGGTKKTVLTPGPLGTTLVQEMPEVLQATRLFTYSWKESVLMRTSEKKFYEDRLFLADPQIFQIFDLPLIYGDPATALTMPNALVISKEMARKYFGSEDPVGKTISITLYDSYDFMVTGVVQNMPQNSHFHADFFAPLKSGSFLFWKEFAGDWRSADFYTYLLVAENSQLPELQQQINTIYDRFTDSSSGRIFLQPLTSIHLNSDLADEIEINGSLSTLYSLALLGAIILIIACVNITNLALARTVARRMEIMLRKVVGATCSHILTQYLFEATLLVFLALPLAWTLVDVFLPAASSFLGKQVTLDYDGNFWAMAILSFSVVTVASIISGLYPGLVLASLNPIRVMKRGSVLGVSRNNIHKSLIIFQFASAIVFLISTAVIMQQLQYIQRKSLGFTHDSILLIPIRSETVRLQYRLLKPQLLLDSGILSVTATTFLPGNNRKSYSDAWTAGEHKTDKRLVRWNSIDYDFGRTFDLEVTMGRWFSRKFPTDAETAYIVNETAAKQFGWKHPLGESILMDRDAKHPRTGKVVGVMKDFHFTSLEQKIEPLVFYMAPERFETIVVKLAADNFSVVDRIEAIWQKVNPGQPFEYSFMNDFVNGQYTMHQRMKRLLGYASILAIIISCMGLLGLISFTAEQRTKEIGIRKILGATVANVTALLSKDFVKLVLLANFIAWPVAWYAMNRWLQNFAYRIEIGWWVFALAGGLALVIALVTVSTQAIKAAVANPVESLRYE